MNPASSAYLRTPLDLQNRLVALVAMIVFAMVGFAFSASTAQAADVDVPDTQLKATMNAAIATATGTTREPTQAITTEDALTVETIEHYNFDGSTAIDSFEGLEAFTNLTTLQLYNMDGAATDVAPIAALPKLTTLALSYGMIGDLTPLYSGSAPLETLILAGLQVSNLDGIGALEGLKSLYLGGGYFEPDPSIRDISGVSALSGLTDVVISGVPNLRDVSALAASKDTITSLEVSYSAIADISFLEGFKQVTQLSLAGNRIEDVSVFAEFDASYALPTTSGSSLQLSTNRVRDFSVVDAWRSLPGFKPVTFSGSHQAIYVGALDSENGVNVVLKPGPLSNGNAAPVPTAEHPSTYNAATGRLVPSNPGAPSATVNTNGGSGHWIVHFSETADRIESVRINEVESNADPRGDWVELYNPLGDAVDISGLVISDNDNTHKIALPEGTRIGGKSYLGFVTDNPTTPGYFGLGGNDSVRLSMPGTTDLAGATAFDEYSWSGHATTTYGRTAPGAGVWRTTREGTFEQPNTFNVEQVTPTVALSGATESTSGEVTVTATVSKPAGAEVAGDATGSMVFTINGQTTVTVPVQNGVARLNRTLEGSPAGIAHEVTGRYVSGGILDPYTDTVSSAAHTVTVTILEFDDGVVSVPASVMAGQPVTVDVSGITPTPDTITYQWQNSQGQDFSGENRSSYTPDYWSYEFFVRLRISPPSPLQVRVTASKAGYRNRTYTSSVVTPELFSVSSSPAATLSTEAPKVGETITATHPEWTSPLSEKFNWHRIGYQYDWLRDGELIEGASDQVSEVASTGIEGGGPKQVAYTVTPEDEGHTISLRVSQTGSALLKDATAISAATAKVKAKQFQVTPAPTIDITAPKTGDQLTASVADWSPAAELTWQWLRDGQPITGETTQRYTVTSQDVDHALSVRVTGKLAGYANHTVESVATAKVKAESKEPQLETVTRQVRAKYKVKVTSRPGRKLSLAVSARGFSANQLPKQATVRVAGVAGQYKVKLKAGKATVKLGKKAAKLKKGAKVKVSVAVPSTTYRTTSTTDTQRIITTYSAAKTTAKIAAKVR